MPLCARAARDGRWSRYREFPSASAAVACAWSGEPGWPRALRVLPDGCTDVVWTGRDLVVLTPAAQARRVELVAVRWTAGVRLRCGVAGSVLGHDLGELPSGPVPLRELWPGAERFEDSLAGAGDPGSAHRILAGLVGARPVSRWGDVVRALAAPAARVAEVGERFGLSERGVRRHLLREVGLGPKPLQRVLRFRRFVGCLDRLATGRTTLARVAAELGYADQSHLGRDCLRLAGATPATLVAARGRNVPDIPAGEA